MSRSPIRTTILALQSLVALAAVAGAVLGAAVYLDGRGHPEGFAELAGFLGLVFAVWCLVVLVAAAATIRRIRRDRPGTGALTILTSVVGLVPVLLVGVNTNPPIVLAALPFGALLVLGVLETTSR